MPCLKEKVVRAVHTGVTLCLMPEHWVHVAYLCAKFSAGPLGGLCVRVSAQMPREHELHRKAK